MVCSYPWLARCLATARDMVEMGEGVRDEQ
jgi:hypothetical protein